MCGRIRQANIGDALEVAAIIDIAGHGIDLTYWMENRDSDHSVLAAARRVVIEDDTSPYHYSRAYLIEVGGRIAGGLIGGMVSEEPDVEEHWPAHFAPLVALENRAPSTWNIIAIAVHAEFRGKGLAVQLLDHAAGLASQSGAQGLSIVVEDTNIAATALYTKKGFEEVDALPWIAYGDRTGPTRWLMLTRPI